MSILLFWSLGVGLIAGAIVLVWCHQYIQFLKKPSPDQVIVTEFLPPKGISLLAIARLIGVGPKAVSAQIIDLAVRGYLRIIPIKSSNDMQTTSYDVLITGNIDELKPEEYGLIRAYVGSSEMRPGIRFSPTNATMNDLVRARLDVVLASVRGKTENEYAIMESPARAQQFIQTLGRVSIAAGFVLLLPPLAVAGFAVHAQRRYIRVYTSNGQNLERYTRGLKQYMQLAEKDRIRHLQSPDNAEIINTEFTGDNTDKVLKLYECLLPYAILFDQEKQWAEQIGKYCGKGRVPDWYQGGAVGFDEVDFSYSIEEFSNQTSAVDVSDGDGGEGEDAG